MSRIIIGLLITLFFIRCSNKKQSTIKLKFVDEFVLQDSLRFQNTLIGGLSGIDYDGDNFYFVVDDSNNPRILKASIQFNKDTISKIDFLKLIEVKDSSVFFKENALDLESVIYDKKEDEFHLVSEGSINKGKEPSIFKINAEGNFISAFEIPEYLKTRGKHNASFESSTLSIDEKGIWTAMEGVIKGDGEEPAFTKTNSPIRLTLFNKNLGQAKKQYAYMLDGIEKPKKGKINLNGVTAILADTETTFFVLERGYQSGYNSYGNTVKLYRSKIKETTTNTLNIESLESTEYIPMEKELVLNFNDIKEHLTNGIIDNIEGITFGPLLANGNRSLIVVSDDNFQRYDKQINQFIILEIEEKN